MTIRRHLVLNRDIERHVLISLITSDEVLRNVAPILDPSLFDTAVGKRVAGWVSDYNNIYHDAPKRLIQNIFDQEKGRLKPEEEENIAEFLQSLSDEYLEVPSNPVFMTDQATDYLKRRKLMQVIANTEALLTGNSPLVDAETMMNSYHQTMAPASRWLNPVDLDYVLDTFQTQESPLYELPGELGKILGRMERGHLMGIMGPMKRGKTWWLLEFAFQAMTSRKRVAFISCEMQSKHLVGRFLKRLTAGADEGREVRIRAFDCKHNQENLCRKPQREGSGRAYGEYGYRPCTACRGDESGDYEQVMSDTWEYAPTYDEQLVYNQMRRFIRMYGSNMFRLIHYPPFSASLKAITADIEYLYWNNFVPDVIIVDYADILAPEAYRSDYRHQVNETWMALKRLAAEKQVQVITATQGNRATLQKEIIEQTDISEDIRKLAHVDIFFALSQTTRMRRDKLMGVNVLAHRWQDFDPYKLMLTTYDFNIGQSLMDTTVVDHRELAEQANE